MDCFHGFSPRLLLIENNERIAETLLSGFEKEGYLVKWSAESTEVFSTIEHFVPNLIILSWDSVGINGLDLCLKLRSDSTYDDTKIIVVSNEYKEIDAIRILTVGADDYLSRPISDIELIARAWSQLRFLRAKSYFTGGKKTIRKTNRIEFIFNDKSLGNILRHNGIEMHIDARDVRRHGQPITLRDAEFRLLALLLREPKKIFTRQELINNLWEHPDKIDYRTIDVMMGRIRKALTLPNRTDAVRAVRGLGYGLSLDDPLTARRKTRRPQAASHPAPLVENAQIC